MTIEWYYYIQLIRIDRQKQIRYTYGVRERTYSTHLPMLYKKVVLAAQVLLLSFWQQFLYHSGSIRNSPLLLCDVYYLSTINSHHHHDECTIMLLHFVFLAISLRHIICCKCNSHCLLFNINISSVYLCINLTLYVIKVVNSNQVGG